jgi:hypothetical protein
MSHVEDRARLVRFVASVRALVCSTEHAGDQLVDRLGSRSTAASFMQRHTASPLSAWAVEVFTVISSPSLDVEGQRHVQRLWRLLGAPC